MTGKEVPMLDRVTKMTSGQSQTYILKERVR